MRPIADPPTPAAGPFAGCSDTAGRRVEGEKRSPPSPTPLSTSRPRRIVSKRILTQPRPQEPEFRQGTARPHPASRARPRLSLVYLSWWTESSPNRHPKCLTDVLAGSAIRQGPAVKCVPSSVNSHSPDPCGVPGPMPGGQGGETGPGAHPPRSSQNAGTCQDTNTSAARTMRGPRRAAESLPDWGSPRYSGYSHSS